MPDIATPEYARALLAELARKMREAVNAVLAYENDAITQHKLAEVVAECNWCEREYGENENKEGNRNG